jgi:FemAB-related protein (PEP-CTERM system-associated)
MELPESSDALMKSFKSKLRSQIKKPLKHGLTSKIGGEELLHDFYDVFASNMRDLGSPVHSKKLFQNVLGALAEDARIAAVYKQNRPVAGALIIGFKETVQNPWASALREFGRYSPNMLLYWTMLEYACDNGFRYFDFGRSSPDSGTHRFKEQWGARPIPLHWYYIFQGHSASDGSPPKENHLARAVHYWQKLPVGITKAIGPAIRKHISL